MSVVGLGGIFFRAQDPDALTAWYKENLGVGAGCNASGEGDAGGGDAGEWYWNAVGGNTVFAPFKAATDYWPADKAFMMNLRVRELDALLEKLRAAGIAVRTEAEWDDPTTGRFARIHDPEGNPIELWEEPEQA